MIWNLLLAPDSGGAIRRKIINASGDFAGNVKDSLMNAFKNITEQTKHETNAPAHRTIEGEEKIPRVMHNAKEEIA